MSVLSRGEELGNFTLRTKHRNRVLRKIFGQKLKDLTGGWRKLHNEKLHYLRSSPNEINL